MYILYIKKYRQLRRITQNELAELVGTSQQQISLLEADNIIRKRSPQLALLKSISLALKICPKDILFYSCMNCEIRESCSKKDKVNYEDVAEENLQYYI